MTEAVGRKTNRETALPIAHSDLDPVKTKRNKEVYVVRMRYQTTLVILSAISASSLQDNCPKQVV